MKAEKRESPKATPVSKDESYAVKYKEKVIKRTQRGFEVLGETWNTLGQAKEFVDIYMATGGKARVRNGVNNRGPIESTVSDTIRTGKSMGRYLDSQLGRFVNPAIDRVQPTLTQGDSRAYVIEMESRKYLAWVVDGSGERREREFEGARAKEAAKAWARLVLFEVAKAGTQHNPAASPEQYRLAQAVLSGTARGAHMPVKVAREIVEKTPAAMRSEYSRYNPTRPIYLVRSKTMYRTPPETLTSNLTGPTFKVFGGQAEIIHKGRGGRVLVKGEYDGQPFYGWLSKEDYTRTKPNPSHGPVESTVSRSRPNPESSSMDMYSSFHGRPSRETVEITETIHDHDNVAALGTCCGFLIVAGSKQFAIGLSGYTWSPRADGPGKKKGGFVKTDPAADDVFLSSNEEGTQMFVDGGDQELDLSSLGITGHEAEKEAVVIGDVAMVAYETEKEFDKFDLIQYVHTLSEDSKGPLPVLRYMRRNSKGARMFLDGGVYYIEKPLVGTSPGIED